MAFPLSAPNLTAQKLRRKGGDVSMRQYQVDPHWGIPEGQPPLSVDSVTGLVRPFSSFVTRTPAVAGFVGFADDTFPPGENHSVWVYTEGWVEMLLDVAAEVLAGDYFEPLLITATTPDHVSDDTVTASTAADANAIFRAVKSCICNPFFDPVSCPDPVPVAVDVSPTAVISRQTQRTVLLYFNTQCCMAPAGGA